MKLFCQMRMLRRGSGLLDDGPHDLAAGLVAQGVDDPRVRVAPFAAQGDVAVDLVEMRAPVDQLADPIGCLADDHLDDLGVAEPLAGGQRVGDVVVEPVLGVEDAGDPALGVVAVALADLVLGDDQHAVAARGSPARPGSPAIPPPMTRTSVKWCGSSRGSNPTRYRRGPGEAYTLLMMR